MKIIKKNRFIFILTVALLIFIERIFGHAIWYSRFFNHYFVDSNNKFNWIGITSILAILTLGFNAWDRRRQFRGDLISKSRIKWIERAELIVAEYLSLQDKYLNNNQNYYYYLTIKKISLKKIYLGIILQILKLLISICGNILMK